MRLRDLLVYLKPHGKALGVVSLVSLVGAAAALAQPLLVQAIIASVSDGTSVTLPVVIAVAVLVGSAFADALQQYLLSRAAENVVYTTRRRLVASLLRLPVVEYDRRRTGDLTSRVSADTTLVRSVVTSGLVDIGSSALIVVGALIAMAITDGALLAVTLLGVLLGAAVGILISRQLRQLSLITQSRVGEMTAAVERSLTAVRTIRASGATQREEARVLTSAAQARDAGVHIARTRAAISPLMTIAVQGALVAVLAVGGARVASGALTVGELVAFVLYLFLLILPLGTGLNAYSMIQQGLGALTRISEISELPQEGDGEASSNCGEAVWTQRSLGTGGVATPVGPPILQFDNVSFAYEDGAEVLRQVNFSVPSGSQTAIVGPSGAGKSSLLALVERFYEVTGGTLRFYGQDIRDLPHAELRKRIGYVEQDAPALAGTLAENLRLTDPGATEAALRASLDLVNLTDLADRSPVGLDAQVGESGVRLSGGERQRLAIARSLLSKPNLLLLDEPTASLDAHNEDALRAGLAAAARQSTVLIVAHRLSTVINSDQIVVLEAGRVVGIGTHSELLATCSLYRELATAQSLGTV